jgi:cell division septal protein FtsQ
LAKKIKLDAKYRYNQGSGRRKKMLIALLILLVLLFLNSFVFSIREVVVTGNEVVSAEEIQEELGLTEGMNMFHFLIGSAFQKMDLNPRIETVDIYVHWPNSLEIQVKDWGVGIADVEQARQPLYTTGTEERSGMGFTIMESFMDAVKVRSTPGKGTVVTLRRRVSRRMGAPV